MAYGTVKVDNVTFTYNSADATTTFSGFYASTTNNLTLSGTASAATFTGTTANFTNTNAQNISVTTLLSGLAITGGTAGFTIVTGTTVTGTTANFVTVSGTTVTGTTAQFTSITGGTAGFTTITGTTVTGTTANFVTVSGTTVTGTTASFTSGIFTSLSGTTHTITSGVFALGTAALPSISFVSDPNTGIYSPGADQVAVATNGTGRLFIDASGNVGVKTSAPFQYGAPEADLAHIQLTSQQYSILTFGGTAGATGKKYWRLISRANENKFQLQSVDDSGNNEATAIEVVKGTAQAIDNVQLHTNGSEKLRITSTGTLNFKGAGTAGSTQAVSFYGSAPVDSLVVDSSGQLGVGTSVPNYQLHATTSFAVGAAGFNQQLSFTNDTIQSLILGTGYTPLKLNPLGGNVGIGTSAPDTQLHVSGNGLIKISNGTQNGWFGATSTAFGFWGSGVNPFPALAIGTTSNHPITIGTNNIGRLIVDTSGNVGIGTTSVDAAAKAAISNGGAEGLEFRAGNTAGVCEILTYNRSSSAYTDFRYDAATHQWKIGGVDKAKLDSSGRLLVGTTTAINDETGLGVVAAQATAGAGVVTFKNSSAVQDSSSCLVLIKASATTSSSARFMQFFADGTATAMGGIVGSGAGNVAFATLSDIRDKKNIQPLVGSLSKIKQIEVVSYDWKTSEEHVNAGFIAQNIETIFPEYVVENMAGEGEDDRKGITGGLSSGYVAVLTAALQEAIAKIESLEARLTAAGID